MPRRVRPVGGRRQKAAQQPSHYAAEYRADDARHGDFLEALHQLGEVAERIFGIFDKE